ncbi:hypothetical protein E0493_21620 [Roseomonas sp. M0104]|uniref:Uncharacterized protein n=1 Tax=Teichococcus coralli TaxID=2545983 RepID=A0A845BIP8_9PROT|nr:hypothetical protein [Pseudoroseomonas coralli]MXP65950.1 hypothetical protein [Pseudoroseomonas coralli]
MTSDSSGAQTICGCGRPLKPEEAMCPHCTQDKSSFWKQIGSAVAAATPFVIGGILFIVSKGKIKPSA